MVATHTIKTIRTPSTSITFFNDIDQNDCIDSRKQSRSWQPLLELCCWELPQRSVSTTVDFAARFRAAIAAVIR